MLKWWNRWLTDDKRANRAVPLIEELEPRVLLSADAAGIFAPDPAELQQQAPTELLLDENLEPAPTQQVIQEENRSLELVFVDPDSPDYQSIVDSLTDASDGDRQFAVILLDNNRDGVWQISQALQNYRDVDAIHLVSHGDRDGIDLGNTRLDANSLAVQQDQFLAWADYLADGADILIYGCNLASADSGLSLMHELAQLTGADVAASEDLTGHSSLGGNWVLEARVGAVDTQVFASQGLLQAYRATLAAPVANDDNGDSYSEVIEGISDGYFRLGDASDIADETAGGNDGTAVGGVSTGTGGATGDGDDSLTLNGTDGYVSIPHSADYELTEGAISLWFNSTAIVNGDTLFSKDASGTAEGGHLTIRFTGNGAAAELEVRLQNNTASGTDSHFVYSDLPNGFLNDGNWHNVVFTFGPAGMALYVDGAAADTTGGNAHLDIYDGGMAGDTGLQGDGGDTPNQEPIALGASRRTSGTGMTPPSGPFFQGSIDELAIVNQQLTPAQVAELYTTPGVPYEVDEDNTLAIDAANGVLANDTDADDDPLTASLVSGPGNADAFTLNSDGSFTYTPAANFSGTDSFVYQADDGNGGTDTATATITVNAVADNPSLWDHHQTVSLDAPTPSADYLVEVSLANVVNGFQYSNADANGDDLRFYDSSGTDLDYFIDSWNVGGTSTVWVGVADAGTTEIDFYYGNPDAIAKSTGSAGTGTIVTTLSDEGFSIDENSPNTSPVGTVLAEDFDGDGLTFTITGGNTSSAFAIDNAGLITVANSSAVDLGVNPTFALTVEVDDGTGRTDTTTVNISLNDITAPGAAVITGIDDDTNVAADGTTSDNQLVFNGTAEANSVVEVFIDGGTIGTTSADGSGSWSFDHSGTTLTDGSYTVTAHATDAAGNTGALSADVSLTVDTGDPAPPATMAISVDSGAADRITSDNQLVFSGSAEANSSVEVFLDSGSGPVSIDTVSADGSGNWTVDYTAVTLADGNYTLTAQAADLAGNTSLVSAGLAFTVDTAGPAAAATAISDDTGAADLVTLDNQLTFSGTAEANNSVEVFLDGASLGSVTADGSGNWSFDHTGTTLADASYTLTAQATDSATGQAGALSGGLNFTVDTAAPAAAVSAITDDTNIGADGVTSDNQLVFSGTAEASSNVEVFLDGASLGSVITDGSGNWSLDYTGTTLADGSYILTAQATDSATGQAGAISGGFTFTVDSTAPATTTVVSLSDDTGAADRVTSDNQLVFAGTAEANSSVEVFLDGSSIGTTSADGTGDWSFDYTGTTLTDGSYTLTAVATDLAGNTGPASGGLNFTVDTVGPAAAVDAISDDTGAADLITLDNQLVFSGTAEANNSVEVFLDGASLGSVTADGSGNWSFGHTGTTLADASYTLTAQATDTATGQAGALSAGLNFTIDTAGPAAAATAISDDTGAADLVTLDNQLVFSGTAEANNSVEVFLNGASLGSATADGSGNWSLDYTGSSLADGSYTLTARATDTATGQTGALSGGLSFTIDTAAPSAAVSTITADTNIAADGVTSDNQLVISGTAEASNSVEVFLDGASVGSVNADGSGNWSLDYTGTTLADGSYVLTAQATDSATGQAGAISVGFNFTVDSVAPAAPTVVSLSDDTGAADFVTADNQLVFSGTAEPNSAVEVFLGAISIGTTSANGSGNWVFDHSATTLADGTYTLTAEATDLAGNTSPASGDFNFRVDTIPPPNNAPTGSVSIDNTAPAQGDLLTASNDLSDPDGLIGVSYHWQRDTGSGFVDIGTTGNTYTATQDDVGATLRVEARYTDLRGFNEVVGSAATAVVANVDDIGSGEVSINNLNPVQGDTLTASNTLDDPDGLSGTVAYQWQRDGEDIPGQNGTIYVTTQADVGTVISVVASYIDDLGGSGTSASVSTAPVANVNDAPTGSVVISGEATEDRTLTVNNTLADADGISGPVSYQWTRNGEAIEGATGNSYVLTEQDSGAVMTVIASYTDDYGTVENFESAGVLAANGSTPVEEPPAGEPPEPRGSVPDDEPDNGSVDVPGGVIIPDDQANDDSGTEAPVTPPANEDSPEPLPNLELSDPVLDGDISTNPVLVLGDNLDIGNRVGTGSNILNLSNHDAIDLEDDSETDDAIAEAERDRELVEDLLQLIQGGDSEEEFTLASGKAMGVTSEEESEDEEELAVVDDILTNHALWDAIDRMNEEMASHSDNKLTRDELVVQFVSASGLGLFAAATVYALRGGALMASWLSTVPLWGTLDPLPVLRGRKEENEDEMGGSEKSTRERKAESLFSGQEHA